jgi:hypothetical protein
MNNDDLLLRQQRLLVRSAQLRLSLADQAQVFKKPMAVVDQVRNGLQWLYRNPEWPLGALVLLALLRPRRTLLWTGRLWWAWTAFNRARSWAAALPIQRRSP